MCVVGLDLDWPSLQRGFCLKQLRSPKKLGRPERSCHLRRPVQPIALKLLITVIARAIQNTNSTIFMPMLTNQNLLLIAPPTVLARTRVHPHQARAPIHVQLMRLPNQMKDVKTSRIATKMRRILISFPKQPDRPQSQLMHLNKIMTAPTTPRDPHITTRLDGLAAVEIKESNLRCPA